MAKAPDVPTAKKGATPSELDKIQYQGVVDNWKATERDPVTESVRQATLADTRQDKALEVQNARQDVDRAAEAALLTAIQAAYIDVAKSSLDRALKRADYLVASFTAVTTVYTALLGLIWAAADAADQELPARALIPVVFLGLAITLAAIYVAFLRRNVKQRNLLPSGIGGTIADERLKTFLDWVFSGVLDRAWSLRTSIVAFGLGVATLPLPFVDLTTDESRAIGVVCGVILLAWLGGEYFYRRSVASTPYVPDPPSVRLR